MEEYIQMIVDSIILLIYANGFRTPIKIMMKPFYNEIINLSLQMYYTHFNN